MLQAMPGKVIIKKVKKESTINGIYINDNNFDYQIVDICPNEHGLMIGNKIIVDNKNICTLTHDNQELGIISITDILAVIK